MQENNIRTTDAYARMSLLLRRALGMVGVSLASLGSGVCGGPCGDSYTECYTLEDLEAWRTQYMIDFKASCVTGSAGEAGASPLPSGSGHAAGAPGTSTREIACRDGSYESISAWDPNGGCPEEWQISALIDEHRWTTGDDLPRAAKNETKPVCCQTVHDYCNGGRPFVVEGEARVPKLVGKLPTEGSSTLSAALALVWTADALAEYASIASFARLTLQLMTFGAPPQLIEASQQASLDEIRHARFCFAEAARHAGRRVEPGPLDVGQACDSLSFESFMLLNLIEGCVGENLAALRVAEQARLAASPALARALTQVSQDETRHAELAFEILRFGLEVNRPATHAALRRVLEMRFEDELADSEGCIPEVTWEAHGRLGAKTRRQVNQDAWNLVLTPLLRGLLRDESLRKSTLQRDSELA